MVLLFILVPVPRGGRPKCGALRSVSTAKMKFYVASDVSRPEPGPVRSSPISHLLRNIKSHIKIQIYSRLCLSGLVCHRRFLMQRHRSPNIWESDTNPVHLPRDPGPGTRDPDTRTVLFSDYEPRTRRSIELTESESSNRYENSSYVKVG